VYSPISTGPLAGVLQFMDERDRVARRPFCVTRGKRPIVGRLPVQTSHNGTLPTFCVPLWVACARPTPSPPTPRPSSHVDTNQPAGHRSPRSFLAGLLQFLVQVSETNEGPSFSTTQKDPTVGRSQVLASHSGTLRPFCVPLWDEQTHALTKAPHREAPQSPRTPGASQMDA